MLMSRAALCCGSGASLDLNLAFGIDELNLSVRRRTFVETGSASSDCRRMLGRRNLDYQIPCRWPLTMRFEMPFSLLLRIAVPASVGTSKRPRGPARACLDAAQPR